MSRILVFNAPAHGHLNPTLHVVRELVSRGEQVAHYLADEFEPQNPAHRRRIPPSTRA